MAPTPSKSNLLTPKLNNTAHVHSRTPQSKRLNFNREASAEHPVEVIGRIRNHPENKTKPPPSALHIHTDGKSLRVKTEIGYRDFTLDGVSLSEDDDLDGFYKKFVQSRINGVKLGNKCTIMMYGPTGSGKSHTMFGCPTQPGIVYKSLKDILGESGEEEEGERLGLGTFVQVTVLEIYNEEIYDLLSSNTGGGFGFGWPKAGSASKARLEVMGKKAKNATFISGNEAGKILKEIQKVEKKRIVKSTLCNERSSRSHCMIILDVPTVGGQLLLVDMAGSENIEQAGQIGFEAKMQTAKINQGNIALKRVVESIANGDSHVPFRDSKLTMLLQDSFEDDKSKILMILCASPDPKELHKTIATLEYGAKAKCIVRGPHTPAKDKDTEDSSSAVILGSRITALDQFICKLQMENKLKEKERIEAQKELKRKEDEISALRAKLAVVEGRGASEEEINLKVNERTLKLKSELERKIQECQKMANDFVEMERRKMEERMFQQQQEVMILRRRLEEIECEFRMSKAGGRSSINMEGGSFLKRLMETCSDEDMVKSMDIDRSIDMETTNTISNTFSALPCGNNFSELVQVQSIPGKACLTTVYEEDEHENEEEDKENPFDEEVQKEVIEEKKTIVAPELSSYNNLENVFKDEADLGRSLLYDGTDETSRRKRIQNIFTLCGNYRELSQHNITPFPATKNLDEIDNSTLSLSTDEKTDSKENEIGRPDEDLKENQKIVVDANADTEVYVKWEASKENPGKVITTVKVSKESTLADLRKLIEIHMDADKQAFTFLGLGDPSGAPVPKEKEAALNVTKLPVCNNQLHSHLACLRPSNQVQRPSHRPFTPLENKLSLSAPLAMENDVCLSPKISENLCSTPFITVRRY